MSGLGEQIAVLDGLEALDPNDGRIGQMRARVNQYARMIMPGVLRKRNVIAAGGGALYGGGSSYAQGLPLMPSTIGLAGIPSVLPTKYNVVDPSGGANYTGGADWAPGMPLTVSSAGLADALIQGGYGRAGLGAPLIQGGYGRAGLGTTGTAVDEDLAAAAEAVEVERKLNPNDGRIGQQRAQVDEYGRAIMPGVLARSNVVDPSEGALFSGGSSHATGMPLMPSTIGLAGFDAANEAAKAARNGRAKALNMTPQQRLRLAVSAAQKLSRTIAEDTRRYNTVALTQNEKLKLATKIARERIMLQRLKNGIQKFYANQPKRQVSAWD